MPTNDPNQSKPDREEWRQVIARTLLRTFLATPPMSPQEAATSLRSHIFQPQHGGLMGLLDKHKWISVGKMLKVPSTIIAFPEMTETMENYPVIFKGTELSSAMPAMMCETLGIEYNDYQLGHLKPYPGFFRSAESVARNGHAIFIEPDTYRAMAKKICWIMADAEQGARLLGVINVPIYRDALRPDLPSDNTKKTKPAASKAMLEWSELRDVARNMLAASNCDSEQLDQLYERAQSSENSGFMTLVQAQRQKNASKPNDSRGDAGREAPGR